MPADNNPADNACTVYRCVYTVLIGYIHYAQREGSQTSEPSRVARGDAPRRRTLRGRPQGCEEGQSLDIIISASSNKPIYEQITNQIRSAIVTGQLAEGEQLPSIRALANSLRVSAITTKRAYADLEAAGLIQTVQGKGSFVAGGNAELIREEQLRQVEEHMLRAIDAGRAMGLSNDELSEMFALELE